MRRQCFKQHGEPSTIREDAWQCLGATGKEEPQASVVKGQERRWLMWWWLALRCSHVPLTCKVTAQSHSLISNKRVPCCC